MTTMSRFHVRLGFLVGCLLLCLLLVLPDLAHGRPSLQGVLLLCGMSSVVAGWMMFAPKDIAPSARRVLASFGFCLVTATVLVAFCQQLIRWSPTHPILLMYLRRWFYWGLLSCAVGVLASLFGRGRSRMAFVAAGCLFLALQASVGASVY